MGYLSGTILVLTLAGATIMAGCADMKKNKITLKDVTYEFPQRDIEALVQDQGHTFIRLRPANADFQLLFNTRSDRKQLETGKLVISGVSDQFGEFENIPSPVGVIVCKETPHWSCGFEVFDQGVRWSVVFDRARISDVERLKPSALSILKSYRT